MLYRWARVNAMRVLLFTGILAAPAQAQILTKRFEVGAHFGMLALSVDEGSTLGPANVEPFCPGPPSVCLRPSVITYPFKSMAAGFGGRFGYALNDHFGLEGEVNYYPTLTEMQLDGERSALEARAGVRAGWRGTRAGIFGKVRPGFLRFESDVEDCQIPGKWPPPCPTTKFGVDFGGIIEFYMDGRWLIRFDVGDMFILRNPYGPENQFHHNLEISTGVGFRF